MLHELSLNKDILLQQRQVIKWNEFFQVTNHTLKENGKVILKQIRTTLYSHAVSATKAQNNHSILLHYSFGLD